MGTKEVSLPHARDARCLHHQLANLATDEVCPIFSVPSEARMTRCLVWGGTIRGGLVVGCLRGRRSRGCLRFGLGAWVAHGDNKDEFEIGEVEEQM